MNSKAFEDLAAAQVAGTASVPCADAVPVTVGSWTAKYSTLEWNQLSSAKGNIVATPATTLTSATPTIVGTVKAGKTVKANGHKAQWTAGTQLTFKWFVAGTKVSQAKSLKLKAAWAGKKLVLRVTGQLAGYSAKTVSSKAVTIAA
jgi:hypothetical protein